MKIKIFTETLMDDKVITKVQDKYAQKGKTYDSIESRVNDFIKDKNVLNIETTTTGSFGENKITITVQYED